MVFNYFGTYYPNLTFIRVKREIRGEKRIMGGGMRKFHPALVLLTHCRIGHQRCICAIPKVVFACLIAAAEWLYSGCHAGSFEPISTHPKGAVL
jgi:hypothetical protein